MKTTLPFLFFVSTVLSAQSYAQSQNESEKMPPAEAIASDEKVTLVRSRTNYYLSAQYNGFLTDSVSDFSNPFTGGAGLHSFGDYEEKSWEIDAEFRYYAESSRFGFASKNAYHRWSKKDWTLWLGRKYLDWLENENFWSMSKLQPLRAFNLIDSEKEGLTGLFAQHDSGDGFRLSFFITYLHIPQLNPGVEEVDSKIKGANEWVLNPPTKVKSDGADIDVRYSLEQPSIEKIVFQSGYGVNAEYYSNEFKMNAFIIRKPETKLRLAIVSQLDPIENKLDVTIDPKVNFHTLYGASAATNYNGWTTHISGFVDLPDNGVTFEIDDVEGLELESEMSKETYIMMGAVREWTNWLFQVEYITNIEDKESENDIINEAPVWLNALGLSAEFTWSENLVFLATARKDFATYDGVYRLQATHTFTDNWKATLGADLVEAEDTNTYWSNYRSNDSVWINITKNF